MLCPTRVFRLLLLTILAVPATPALADHAGPSGGIAAGGGINTVSAGTLDDGQWAAAARLSFAKPDSLADAELLARDARGIDAHRSRAVISPALALAYGVTHHLTISAELPYIQRVAIRGVDAGAINDRGTSAGVGDLTLLAKYKVAHDAHWGVALIGGVKAPTGSTHQRDRNGDRLETEHQPGTGSWDPIAGIATSFGFDANAIDASLIYQKATNGAQLTRLGDRAQAGLAFSHRFGQAGAHHHHHHDALAHQPGHDHHDDDHDHVHADEHHASIDAIIELNGEWEGRERVAGLTDAYTGGRVLWLSPGARFTSASGWAIAGSLGLPLAQEIRASHPDSGYRLSVSISRAF
jgi:hypothetical protein